VTQRQAWYDGVLGARAMHSLQSYKQEPVYDGQAYTCSSTYHAGMLKIYVHHITESVDGTPEYHMTQVGAWALTGDSSGFRQGVTAFRNTRDWAQEWRDTLISAANERAHLT